MDRFAAMILLLGTLVFMILVILTLFSMAPVVTSCILSLLYSLYLFMAYEESGIHHAQEFENRFWTIFAVLLSTALFFAKDSPIAFGLWWSPSLGLLGVILSGYAMHVWDRYVHRIAMSSHPGRHWRPVSSSNSSSGSTVTGQHQSSSQQSLPSQSAQSLIRLRDLGIPVEDQLARINACLKEIDQLLIPSTINNFINIRYIQAKEREIISIFEDCDARALNYLIGHVKLGLLFYKIKDHRNFHGKHRTELIHLLAHERLAILTVLSRVIVLHSLQLLKLRANPKAEYWVHHILLHTHQDDLSELKTLTDAKGDYFCMNKLIYDDIKSESVRQDILHHIRREAAIQQMHWQSQSKRRLHRPSHLSMRPIMTWRKVLSDVDDTLTCSGGMYPAGIDKRYPKKTVYPGALAFYRELDLGTEGPEEWEDDRVGNLVFLSARPHIYRDMSEKHNFAKFEKLRAIGHDGRKGMHTTPSLLAGDIASGSQFMLANDFEPLATKKWDNFRRYVNLYPEYQHVFVCDNGQGDVRAGEMMFDSFPYEFEALYVHIVQDIDKTYGYDLERWKEKEFQPFFFRTYPEAALHAVQKRDPPLVRVEGLQRICQDTVKDFALIQNWASEQTKAERRRELNQSLWLANEYLRWRQVDPVELIHAEQLWPTGERVRTPYGIGIVRGFDPEWDMYDVELDWRPLDVQCKEHERTTAKGNSTSSPSTRMTLKAATTPNRRKHLATVPELEDEDDVRVSLQKAVEPRENQQERSAPTQQSCGEPSAERPVESARESQNEIPPNRVPSSISLTDSASLNESTSKQAPGQETQTKPFVVTSRLSGACLSKYTPPSLPRLSVRSSLFTFMTTSAAGPETPKRMTFKAGEEYNTPYGPVHVVEWREDSGIVVVDMIGWEARAYLQEDLLVAVSQSFLRSFLRQLGATGERPLEFPHAQGTTIETPFGEGTVKKPLPSPSKRSKESRSTSTTAPVTIGISLDGWTLGDGSHPMLFCPVETAQAWRDQKEDGNLSIFSTLGNLVTSSRSLLEPFLPQPPQTATTVSPEDTLAMPKVYPRYYKDAAVVSTPYGPGRVLGYREQDGFYKVALTQWRLSSKAHAHVFVRGVDLGSLIASGCHEGYPVLTHLGLTGILASVEPTTGVHIVTVPSAGMVCYLQPECVLRPIKAAVGEDVLTMYGDGTVESYDLRRDIYAIRLKWSARLYAKGDTFDRVVEGIQDRDGPFGVKWLLRLLFFSSEPVPTRSRSNSMVSGTSVSQRSKG